MCAFGSTFRSMVPRLFRLFVLTAVLSPALACLQVQAEAPNVTVTQKDIVFDGVPTDVMAALGSTSMTKSFSQSHSKLDLPSGLTPTVDALSVTLTAKSGPPNLDFIQALRITMSGGGTPVTLVDYEKGTGRAPVGKSLTVQSLNPANVFEQWKSDMATFTLTVAGDLPPDAWTVDAVISFSGRLDYSL